MAAQARVRYPQKTQNEAITCVAAAQPSVAACGSDPGAAAYHAFVP